MNVARTNAKNFSWRYKLEGLLQEFIHPSAAHMSVGKLNKKGPRALPTQKQNKKKLLHRRLLRTGTSSPSFREKGLVPLRQSALASSSCSFSAIRASGVTLSASRKSKPCCLRPENQASPESASSKDRMARNATILPCTRCTLIFTSASCIVPSLISWSVNMSPNLSMTEAFNFSNASCICTTPSAYVSFLRGFLSQASLPFLFVGF
mmetsp:Transcript_96868/g.260474  ORF Transcript_96868/g.260474 Transcript_96868/m.260474 type:complete len:207 (-) Transcript_96868:376-996(-)